MSSTAQTPPPSASLQNIEPFFHYLARNSSPMEKSFFLKVASLLEKSAPLSEKQRQSDLSSSVTKTLQDPEAKNEEIGLQKSLRMRIFALYFVFPLVDDISSKIFRETIKKKYQAFMDAEKQKFNIESYKDFIPEPVELYSLALQLIRFSVESVELLVTNPDELLKVREFRVVLGVTAASIAMDKKDFKQRLVGGFKNIEPFFARLSTNYKTRGYVEVMKQAFDWIQNADY
jgi:hypothetical protein